MGFYPDDTPCYIVYFFKVSYFYYRIYVSLHGKIKSPCYIRVKVCFLFHIDYDIFVNCNWVATRWQ